MTEPKARFMKKVEENVYLSVSVWSGKTHPEDEIIRFQVRERKGDEWSTKYEMSLYRTSDGHFSELKSKIQ
ncbi:MAG: hypothetical protein ACP5NC_08645 [Nitrososphaeria archaeon]